MHRSLVIDGNNLAMRAIHAMNRPGGPHLAAEGVGTGPLLVFVNMLSKAVRTADPDSLAVCWDGGVSAHRVAILDSYKGHRNTPDAEFTDLKDSSFALMKEFCALAGLHQVVRPGVEADDLIAAYVLQSPLGKPMTIVSSDKDFLQLVGEFVTQVRPSGGNQADDVWDQERVKTEYGIPDPWMVAWVLALAGDVSDGVPGIPGVGVKTAVKILARNEWDWHTALDDPKVVAHQADAQRNLSLVSLLRPLPGLVVPPMPSWSPTAPSSVLFADLLGLLNRLQLESVRRRIYEGALWSDGEALFEAGV